MKCLFYAVLKVEGDILLDLNEHDLAIKCFKTLKDYCDVWGDMEKLKMKTYEQIAVCYRSKGKKYKAIEYFKKALFYAYKCSDYLMEVHHYERLAVCSMDAGEPVKMRLYYDRAVGHKIEPPSGTGRNYGIIYIEKKNDKYLQEQHATSKGNQRYRGGNQAMRKGLKVTDSDKFHKIDFCVQTPIKEKTPTEKALINLKKETRRKRNHIFKNLSEA